MARLYRNPVLSWVSDDLGLPAFSFFNTTANSLRATRDLDHRRAFDLRNAVGHGAILVAPRHLRAHEDWAMALDTRAHFWNPDRRWSAFVSDPPPHPALSRFARGSPYGLSYQCGLLPGRLCPHAGNSALKIRLVSNYGDYLADASGACMDICPDSKELH